mmetsp:Transcript_153446/g.490475  ORF Transcript_153446/g.490475 Transcript_153446/m.490475 type:complete len:329 (+) Transcript_153446:550-1536(+)
MPHCASRCSCSRPDAARNFDQCTQGVDGHTRQAGLRQGRLGGQVQDCVCHGQHRFASHYLPRPSPIGGVRRRLGSAALERWTCGVVGGHLPRCRMARFGDRLVSISLSTSGRVSVSVGATQGRPGWPVRAHFWALLEQATTRLALVGVVLNGSCAQTGAGGGTATTLHECLLKNAEREQLAEEDAVFCRKCKEHRQCWKSIEMWNLPSQLIIHLKRFGRDRIDGPLTKIDTPVEFSVDLDLQAYLAQPDMDASYELYGVVNHHGSLGGGHYTANVFVTSTSDDGEGPTPPGGEWFNFNDSRASQASVEDLDHRAGYILFYRRRAKRRL